MTHAERRKKRQASAARGEAHVTWRKVSPFTGGPWSDGGWSGKGPDGIFLYAVPRQSGWEYGFNRDGTFESAGYGASAARAKSFAAALLNEGRQQ